MEINVRIPSISKNVPTEQLTQLEADGPSSRKQYKELPLKEEYELAFAYC